eukprot:CAMPEP_0115273646 /NCGR_PEP_ID=MMETSP0270-20121206/55248_1 /TAXON_ID=71861 /ORGANISM="Scrippsiella trochoidea, Strain CCMP3099" /LENGTH=66 /DNA_ID=CAMNT_0002690095 /DNA_START=498 /DNA_END=695 /DNA_ORIENTATION=-
MHQLLVETLRLEPVAALVYHSQGLLNCLLEGAPNRHHFADALHARTHRLVDRGELAKVPSRHLRND